MSANMCGRKSGKGMYVYAKDSKDRPMNQVPPVPYYRMHLAPNVEFILKIWLG